MIPAVIREAALDSLKRVERRIATAIVCRDRAHADLAEAVMDLANATREKQDIEDFLLGQSMD